MQESTVNPKFEEMSRFAERKFLASDACFLHVDQVEKYAQKLLSRQIRSSKELDEWILDRSEFDAAIDETSNILYIRMTCHTDHSEHATAYQRFVEEVLPTVKSFDFKLDTYYLKCLSQFPLDANRYLVYNRDIESDVKLFRQENIDLETKIQLLSQEYQKIFGSMMIDFKGQTRTLPQMGKFLEEKDRALREDAWRATAEKRKEEGQKIDQVFNEMVLLRNKVAHNAGFDNFRDYCFSEMHRFDYGPKDCLAYHDVVEELVVPLLGRVLGRRRETMKLDVLRPWDLAVDALGRDPLKPFKDFVELVEKTHKIFEKINADLGSQFLKLTQSGLMDLTSREGKAPGGYQTTLAEIRKPFIFMNVVGLDDDVRTLLHEAGHAFHSLAAADEPLLDYRHAPLEFCEVASMSQELLGGIFLNEFYSDEDQTRSVDVHLEGIVRLLSWVATVDSFQHWIYTHPQHTVESRQEKWLECHKRFGGNFLDWSGLEDYERNLWHRQLHVFEVPFYYIEYAIAQLGALQIYLNSKKNFVGTISSLRNALSLGGSRPLPELFATARIQFDFSRKTIQPLICQIEKELKL